MKVIIKLHPKDKLVKMNATESIVNLPGKEFEAEFTDRDGFVFDSVEIPTKYCEYIRVKGNIK